MPSSLVRDPRPDDAPLFFEDLTLLESWAETSATTSAPLLRQLLSVSNTEFIAARCPPAPQDHVNEDREARRPLLMVAHDFQGGYNEKPDRRGYTFEHWQLVDSFVYFSHNSISPPPPAWVEAGHRNGVKILGTIIFEWKESIPKLSQLLRGPDHEHLPLAGGGEGNDLFSPFYAEALILLALDRGFDGWLVNIETALELGFQCSAEEWPAWVRVDVRDRERRRNARRLKAWVNYLRITGAARIDEYNKEVDSGVRSGPKRTWHISWYDSVIYPDGRIQYQDALTQKNKAFFDAADSLFTNYTWAAPLLPPAVPGGLPLPSPKYNGTLAEGGYHPALRCSLQVLGNERPRNHIFTGIDVFGRNCYGQHDTYKSLDMIMPDRGGNIECSGCPKGMSVALFAPGWTWEHDEPGPEGRSWDAWWEEDAQFWRGHRPASWSALPSNPPSSRESVPKPVASYFPPHPIAVLPYQGFYSSFVRGSGTRWAVRGQTVLDAALAPVPEKGGVGYTDVGATMPQASSLWPSAQQGCSLLGANRAKARETNDVVWAGNSAVQLSVMLDGPGCDAFVPLIGLTLPHDLVSMRAVCVYKDAGEMTVTPSLDNQPTESKITVLGSGWIRSEAPVNLAALAECTNQLGLQLQHMGAQGPSFEVTVGAVALVPIDANLDGPREIAHVDQHGMARWQDFAPWTPFYEVFALSDPARGEPGKWISSATFDDGTGRTQIQLPRSWAHKSVVVEALV